MIDPNKDGIEMKELKDKEQSYYSCQDSSTTNLADLLSMAY